MKKIFALMIVVLSLALCSAAFADTVIDFHNSPGGPTSAGQSITNQYASLGVLFSTDNGGAPTNASITSYTCCPSTPTYGFLTNSSNGFNPAKNHLNVTFTSAVSNVSFLYNNYGTSS